jgi:transglutaminase-like putative cysteine protease
MRLRIRHELRYHFAEPVRSITHILRLTPRSHEGQHVSGWRIDVDTDCILKAGEDGYGNITQTFTARGPCEDLTILVSGEIESFDAAGVVRGSAERLPKELYLRDTPLTLADGSVRQFAQDTVAHETTQLEKLHGLMTALHGNVLFAPEASDQATPGETLGAKRGTGMDHAHLFIACARHLGYPARATSGYYLSRERQQGIRHAWSEVFVVGLGWVGFDTVHDVCPQDHHVRVATGLDGLAAAAVRGTHTDGLTESLRMEDPYGSGASQRQSQG